MKKKFSRILGTGLAIAMLVSLMVTALPASPTSAETLRWSSETGLPSTLATSNQIVDDRNVNDIAPSADGLTIYAVGQTEDGTTGGYVYKSINGGTSWSRLTVTGLTLPKLVAVAPDDANLVVVVGDAWEVYVSLNGGTTFDELTGHAMSTINSIDISKSASGVHYLAVAGDVSSAAEVKYFKIGAAVPQWISTTNGVDGTLGTWNRTSFQGGIAVQAVKFSPNFAGDKVLAVVTENATTKALFELASLNTLRWNASATFTDYPVTLTNSASATPLLAASIALSPTYQGADEISRVAFIALAFTDTSTYKGSLVRLDDYTMTNIKGGLDGAGAVVTGVAYKSVAFDGTNLAAGAYATNTGYYSANPLATIVTLSYTSTYQRPGGVAGVASKTVVKYAGTSVVAGTSGNSSAFAVSKDNGKSYDDISLIDTITTNFGDVVVSTDGSKVYMVSDDGTHLSVWSKDPAWARILNVADTGNIIRIDPANPQHVYIVDAGSSSNIFYSADSGKTDWDVRTGLAIPVDAAVEAGGQVIYTLTSAGKVYKSLNAGFTWSDAVSTKAGSSATIVSIKKDQLIVGGSSGTIAWSSDGSASEATWTEKTGGSAPFSSGAKVQIAATGTATGDYIYVASSAASSTDTNDGDVLRWKVGTTTSWTSGVGTDIFSGEITGTLTGLALADGSLNALTYVNSTSSNISYIYRLSTSGNGLTPATATKDTIWSSTSIADKVFSKTPQALRASVSSTGIKLWAIHKRTDAIPAGATTVDAKDGLQTFTDTVYKAGPTLASPADAAIPQTNPVTGRASDIPFSWARPSESTGYVLEIALDKAFLQTVVTHSFSPSPNTLNPVVAVVGPYQSGTAQYDFFPGTTYYWRAKATAPFESPYSATRSFAYESLTKFALTAPAVGSYDIPVSPLLVWTAYTGATGYEVELGEDPTFAIKDWSQNVVGTYYKAVDVLKYSTTYYWRARAVTGEAKTDRGPWVTAVFTTVAKPVEATPPVVITPPSPPEVKIVEVPTPAAIPTYLLWVIVGVGAILVIALIVLIARTRRVA